MNNIHIQDSHKISKWKFKSKLLEYKDNEVLKHRSMFSLYMEWIVHNFLYSLHILRSRTGSVDLNYPNKFEWAYIIIGCLVWIFVK